MRRRSLSWADLADRRGLTGWVLIPTTDEVVSLVARHHDLLAGRFQLTTPPWDRVEWACDKRCLNDLADEAGVAHPWTAYPQTPDEVAGLDCPFPVIVKPAVRESLNRLTSDKAWRADDRRSLMALHAEATSLLPAPQVMVQEIVPGNGDSQYSFAALCQDGVAGGVGRGTTGPTVSGGIRALQHLRRIGRRARGRSRGRAAVEGSRVHGHRGDRVQARRARWSAQGARCEPAGVGLAYPYPARRSGFLPSVVENGARRKGQRWTSEGRPAVDEDGRRPRGRDARDPRGAFVAPSVPRGVRARRAASRRSSPRTICCPGPWSSAWWNTWRSARRSLASGTARARPAHQPEATRMKFGLQINHVHLAGGRQ